MGSSPKLLILQEDIPPMLPYISNLIMLEAFFLESKINIGGCADYQPLPAYPTTTINWHYSY